jgi:hypothetical protein
MTKIDDLLLILKRNPKDVRFSDLCRVCDHYFGEPRQKKKQSSNLQNTLAGGSKDKYSKFQWKIQVISSEAGAFGD